METHLDGRQPHLTDEQFTDLLLGANSPSVRAHLKVCLQCAEEAEKVSCAIGSFQQQSLLWAQRRAVSQPLQSRDQQPAFSWLHRRPQAWTAAALAIVLGAGVGISLRVEHERAIQQPIAKAEPAVTVSPTALKADNELLTAIDGELRADDSANASMYGLTATSRVTRTKSSKRISN